MKKLALVPLVLLVVLSSSVCALAQTTEKKSPCETAKEKLSQANSERVRMIEAIGKGEMPSSTDLITPLEEVDTMFRVCDAEIAATKAKIEESLRKADESIKAACELEVHTTSKLCSKHGVKPKSEVLQNYHKACETLAAKGMKDIRACMNLIPLPSEQKKP